MLKPLVPKFRPDLSVHLKDIAEKQVPAKLKPIADMEKDTMEMEAEAEVEMGIDRAIYEDGDREGDRDTDSGSDQERDIDRGTDEDKETYRDV